MPGSAVVETARHEWEESHRRLETDGRASGRYAELLEQVDAITSELRRRVGQTFTLDDLARVYSGADDWAREVVAELSPRPGWPRTLSVVTGAAFLLYARGAVDYSP